MRKAALIATILAPLFAPVSAYAAAGSSASATGSSLPVSGTTTPTILLAAFAFFLIFLGIAKLVTQEN